MTPHYLIYFVSVSIKYKSLSKTYAHTWINSPYFSLLTNVAAPLGMGAHKIAINCKIDMFYRVAKLMTKLNAHNIFVLLMIYFSLL